MKFGKLSKEKRQQLVLVVVLIVLALAGLGFGLIRYQFSNLNDLAVKKTDAQVKLKAIQDTIKRSDRVEAELAELSKALHALEEDMAPNDAYSWIINTVKQFKLPYKVEIPQFSTINPPVDVTLLPKFPYKQVTMTIGGSAYYHELGRFVADFENKFPYFRVENIELEPVSGLVAGDKEKLTFKMDLVTLVKPTSS